MREHTGIVPPNLSNYDDANAQSDWNAVRRELSGLPGDGGLNIAYEAVSRHAGSALKDHCALRWIRKDNTVSDISYAELNRLTARFANLLQQLGIRQGDRVCTFTGRIPELYITALGTLKHRAVYCPIFSVFGPEPAFQRISRGEIAVLVTTSAQYDKKISGLMDKLPHLRFVLLTDSTDDHSDRVLSFSKHVAQASDSYSIGTTNPEDPALLHFTSGTTGMPKGALHVHQAVLTHYLTGKYVLDFHPGDIFWCTADPGWVTGTSYGIISPLVNGVTNIIDEEEFDALRWYGILQEQRVNVFYTAPTAIRRLMRLDTDPKKQYDLSALRLVLSVGEPLNPEAVVWAQDAFGVPVLDNWWQTETGGIMVANYRAMEVRPGSMGKPLPGIEAAIANIDEQGIHIIDEAEQAGHLVLKAGFPSMFRQYIFEEDRYKKCFKDGWYISGDLARKDRDGYFWFIGRADDIIKTSGHMVGPFEVESSLMEHPAVAEAAIIGKPDPTVGELVKAFIVLKAGYEANDDTKLDIIGFARKKLGTAIAPKELSFLDSLPKTRSGKILRRLLKARELGLPEGDLSTLEQA